MRVPPRVQPLRTGYSLIVMPNPHPVVLVVDDNKDALSVLCELLRMHDIEVLQAASGPEALAVARASTPEAILMDLGLPGMSGLDVARQLREEPRFADTFIAALTGFGDPRNRREALDGGFDEYLVKTIDFPSLLAALQTGLAMSRAKAR